MDIQALKLDLVQKILKTDKPSLLSKIDKIFQKEEKNDWWEQLPREIQDSILEGIDNIQKGNTFSHDQVMLEAKQNMAFEMQVIWSDNAKITYFNVLDYLKEN